MTKVLLLLLSCIVTLNVFIHAKPVIVNENEDIMIALARLHEEIDQIRQRLNPIPDLITFASNNVADRLKRYVHIKNSEDESDTVYVGLKVDSEEDVETKFVNLFIDTKRDITAKYAHLDDNSPHINTKVIYLDNDSPSTRQTYPSYRHYRQIKLAV